MKEYRVEVYSSGRIFWHKPGTDTIHRDDGPAVVYNDGQMWWYQNGKIHREDGPAIVDPKGEQFWSLDGTPYTEEQHAAEMKRRNNKDSCSGKVVEIDGKKYKLTEI